MANPFIWHQLNTTDPEAAAGFYGAVVGWTTRAYDEGSDYHLLVAGDRPAAGMMALPGAAEAAGPHWLGYIAVADVDREVEQVWQTGGAVKEAPRDVPTVGRVAAVSDPQGAVFRLITPEPRDAPPPVAPGTPGHAVWHDLQTSDWPAAFSFYAGRFGWEKDHAMDMGQMGTYQIFSIDGAQSGGMFNQPCAVAPAWLHYFAVADIDASKSAIETGGGTVSRGPSEIPGGSFMIHATDPQGAPFAVVGPRRA